MEEIWADVAGFEGYYQVSNLGRIKSVPRDVPFRSGTRKIDEKIMKLATDRYGYQRVCFTVNGRKATQKVHRVVAAAFIPNPMNLPCVNHRDEQKGNNCAENLEWVTYEENSNYGSVKQRRVKNFDYASKVLNTDMDAIAQKLKIPVVQKTLAGEVLKIWSGGKDAAKALGINQSNISSCCNGKRNKAGGFKWEFARME